MATVVEHSAKEAATAEDAACFHCGEPCREGDFEFSGKSFCCNGCVAVYEILTEGGLGHFYDLAKHPGIKNFKRQTSNSRETSNSKYGFLDQAEVSRKLVDYADERLTRVTFHIPAIHCIACVWLIENLFQLHPAIGRCTVHFAKREAAISFSTGKLRLSELVALLSNLGYEPQLTLGELKDGASAPNPARKRQWLQIGLAGFAFGNIMLFSLPAYLGMDSFSGPLFKTVFGWLSLALALPVVVYSASDYWKAAWLAARRRSLTLDVPIALGLAAIYGQSLFEIIKGTGAGYCDSLTGLIFFLLCGRMFQQATYDRLAFDRDYKSFFPLSVARRTPKGEERVALSEIRSGDRLILRNGELVPADATLLSPRATLDYSFVTGESEPVQRTAGDYLYAGGQQIGSAIEIETAKAVSQSYLTSLWNDDAFKKEREGDLNTLTNRYGRQFTRLVLVVAAGSALFWAASGNSARAVKAFASVLIVACPCALALAAPFALGTAQRLLARLHVYLKNALVIERMAAMDAIVFDKTGTLTERTSGTRFVACDEPLNAAEEILACSLARHSAHPNAVQITEALKERHFPVELDSFVEKPGLGLEGTVDGHCILLGSPAWLQREGVRVPPINVPRGSLSYFAVDGHCLGAFIATAEARPEIRQLLGELKTTHEIALLSGDNEKDRNPFEQLFGAPANLHFNQSPLDKLSFIKALQGKRKRVMMVGDGLNDAGALKQSDIGVAVVDRVGAFSPASDVILEASRVVQIADILRFARGTARVVRLSFVISALYNAAGIGIAAAGLLSPLVCAVLMPLSSVTVVLFACGATNWTARKIFDS